MAILKNGRTVAGDWRYENIVDKPLINGNEIKENNNSSASLDIFKVISKADFEAPTFTQNPQCVYAVIDTDENIRFHYTNQLESTDPNYKKYVCKDYWPVEELPAEPAVTEVEENVRLSSILYWLKKTYKHPTTNKIYSPGLYGWVIVDDTTTPVTYGWKNLAEAPVDNKTVYYSEEGTISSQVSGYHDTTGATESVILIDNIDPIAISQDTEYTYITIPYTAYEQYTPNTKYNLTLNYQTAAVAITFNPTEVDGDDDFKLKSDNAVIGLNITDYPSSTLTDYTSCTLSWDKPKEETISYINPLYFPLDFNSIKVVDGKITTGLDLYQIGVISDTAIDPSQNTVLQLVLDEILIKEKVVMIEYNKEEFLMSSSQVGTDTEGTFLSFAGVLNNVYTLIKAYYNPVDGTIVGAKRFKIQPIKESPIDPGAGSYLPTDCIIAVYEDNRNIYFTADDKFKIYTSNGWKGNGTLEYSIDDRSTWITWDGITPVEVTTPSYGKYIIYLRGVGNEYISIDESTYTHFVIETITSTSNADLNLSVNGNIIYLLDYNKSTTITPFFYRLFRDCPIVNAENLVMSNETMGENCYKETFVDCRLLKTLPALTSMVLYNNCYYGMFEGCESLEEAMILPAATLAEGCYQFMFHSCSKLTAAPKLPAITLAKNCYHGMFQYCNSLTIPPTLPATQLAESCYEDMFYSCTKLTTAPELPATTLVKRCYCGMLAECVRLTTPPQLSTTTLAEECYQGMFNSCRSLTTPPELPATTLAENCYNQMFANCTSLTTPPELPATTLAKSCYNSMFEECTSLTIAPTLPATTLANNCYSYMFYGCVSLTAPCELPATIMEKFCYCYMFGNCLGITWGSSGKAYRLPTSGSGTEATEWSSRMFYSNSGSFPGEGTPVINTTYYYIPETTLKFVGTDVSIKNNLTVALKYSLDDGVTWTRLDIGSSTPTSTEVLIKGAINQTSANFTNTLGITGYNVSVSGQLEDGICYSYLFSTQPYLVNASGLRGAENLCNNAYQQMFYSCPSLIAPPELPATTLTENCYSKMFHGCASLKVAPELPATTLAKSCYNSMFYNCVDLTTAPELPATTLAESCYSYMFAFCFKLEAAPELPATTLAENCYGYMFNRCQIITTPPTLPATVMANNCYQHMFDSCGGIRWATIGTPYRLPVSGIGTEATGWNTSMFNGNTGTSIPTNPLIDTVYYLYPETLLRFTGLDVVIKNKLSVNLQYSLDNGSTWSKLKPGSSTPSDVKVWIKGYIDQTSATSSDTLTISGRNVTVGGQLEDGVNYQYLFFEQSALVDASDLRGADILCSDAYKCMFMDCISLVKPLSLLPATILTEGCYAQMFTRCRSLTTPPTLLATTLDRESCYYMFEGCTSLTTAPELPATTLAESCYSNMFNNCTSLIVPPALPATTLADNCYAGMFMFCTSLKITPELPAITLADYCYNSMFYKCTLLNSPCELPATTMANNCYANMFNGCSKIIWGSSGKAYRLPSSGTGTEATGWNENMFANNSGTLPGGTGTPVINTTYYFVPETTLKFVGTDVSITNNLAMELKYSIDNGSTWIDLAVGSSTSIATEVWIKGYIDSATSGGRLTIAGTNVAVSGQLEDGVCYQGLFYEQTALVDASGLKGANILSERSYSRMFSNCTSLTIPPTLPATTLAPRCYMQMFMNCTSLTTPPTLPATILDEACYIGMFNNCNSLTTPPTLPAITLAVACYMEMFIYCTGLTTPPALPATTLVENCYAGMFNNCTSLTTPPTLPATTLASYCYQNMFYNCSALTTPPELPATSAEVRCYYRMFYRCTSLTTAPELPATTLALSCYQQMFVECSSLTTIPSILPATNLAENCYASLFEGCSALITAPELPATSLTENCYKGMFRNCISLITPPALPATTLAPSCYQGMFVRCRSLTTPPTLPATTMANYCYQAMFSGCTGINWATSGTPYRLPASGIGTAATDWSNEMFSGNIGEKPEGTGTPLINTTYYLAIITTLKFTGTDVVVTNNLNIDLTYSIDEGLSWIDLNKGSSTPASSNVWIKGIIDQTSATNSNTLGITGTDVAVRGQLKNNINYKFLFYGQTALVDASGLRGAEVLTSYCYQSMFAGCTSLTIAPELPATDLTNSYNCYQSMFYNCSSLTTAPELPATTLTDNCYGSMFYGCISLTTAPELPATTLAIACYYQMFYGCLSLTKVPELSATTLESHCYDNMFNSCKALKTPPQILATTLAYECCCGMFQYCTLLKTPPELPATTLVGGCYARMFSGCTSLTTPPTLPAITLTEGCYDNMFYNCSSLTTAPELPATTLAENCYNYMFSGCKSLTTPPQLPATILAENCYSYMFNNCTSLTTTPELPATTLADYCYDNMFSGCIALTTPSILPAITMFVGCYQNMFYGCRSIRWALTGIPYRLPSSGTGTAATNWNSSMFSGNSGAFIPVTPTINTTYYLCPETTLKFTGTDVVIKNNLNIALKYSIDNSIWTDLPKGFSTPTTSNIWIKGYIDQSSAISSNILGITGTNVSVDGQLEDGVCYQYLFYGQTALVDASSLRGAKVLCENAYSNMFNGCSSLTTSPQLPATTLAKNCYNSMFAGCTKFTTPPVLPATQLVSSCYNYMFFNCKALTTAPELPATTLVNNCYAHMFQNCTALTITPKLPATTLAQYCYNSMFYNCTSLKIPSELPAINMADHCYHDMFNGCIGIKWATSGTPYKLPSSGTGIVSEEWSTNMFANNSGTLPEETGTPLINTTYYLYPETTLKFTGTDIVVKNNLRVALKYSTDNSTWKELAIGSSTPASSNVWIRGYIDQTSASTSNTLGITGTNVAVDGVLEDGICYKYLFFEQTALVDASSLKGAKVLCDYAYDRMFIRCKSLTTPPTLPAITLTPHCYETMFSGCISLKTAPELPATTLTNDCYNSMFYECVSLKTAPELPATTLSIGCYKDMFSYCVSLKSAPELPATTLFEGCYSRMFNNCKSLTTAPELPATILADYCYAQMFQECILLKKPCTLPAITMAESCYSHMFSDCSGIKWATLGTPYRLPSSGTGTEASSWSEYMFSGNSGTSIPTTPTINTIYYLFPETTLTFIGTDVSIKNNLTVKLEYSTDNSTWKELAIGSSTPTSSRVWIKGYIDQTSASTSNTLGITGTNVAVDGVLEDGICYKYLFFGQTALVDASSLRGANVLCNNAYLQMFFRCTSLTKPPQLPATSLTNYCYTQMFYNCKSLTTAPELPATTLADYCYSGMFNECYVLTTPPTLPATTLANNCYQNMFYDCIALTSTPALPAMTMTTDCYQSMFNNCKSLTTPPELPATTLAGRCYHQMFINCTSLTKPTTLPATTMAEQCYQNMFNGCTGIKWAASGTPYRLPSSGTGTTATDWSTYMFYGNSGTSVPTTPTINTTYYLYQPIETTLKFTGTNVVIKNNLTVALKYSIDNSIWNDLAIGSSTPASSNVWIRGYIDQTSATNTKILGITGTNVAVNGQLEDGVCYKYLFFGQTALVDASKLIGADTLIANCYQYMFQDCTSLTTPPELPATTLAELCYNYMFEGCTSLTTAPKLPATTLANNCYQSMFYGCKALTMAPELPATSLKVYCYDYMFYNCTSLTKPVILPATTMANYCYRNMFNGCTGIRWIYYSETDYRLPASGTGTTATDWSLNMFSGNSGTSIPTTPTINTTYHLFPETTLKFTGTNVVIKNNLTVALKYSIDNSIWNDLAIGSSTPASSNVWIRGYIDQTSATNAKTLGITGTNVAVNGQLGSKVNYKYLFYGQTALVDASGLKCSDGLLLNLNAYQYMFQNCTSLTTPPQLPAIQLSNYCYTGMFQGCTSLTTAPKLPATSLSAHCYDCMFYGCTSLKECPALPATTLFECCYQSMFNKCTSLTKPTTLPATTMANYCYQNMYKDCTGIKWAASGTPYRLPSSGTGTVASGWSSNMFSNNSGTSIPTTPTINTTYYLFPETTLKFTGTNVVIKNNLTVALKYSIDNSIWNDLAIGSSTPASSNVWIRGYIDQTSATNAKTLGITGTNVVVDGVLEDGVCYKYLFYGQTALVDASSLKGANIVCANGYERMFNGCTNLKTPCTLPATTLAENCYTYMFNGCTNLTRTVGELPATTLYKGCYWSMFEGCKAITSVNPKLLSNATVMAEACYKGFFYNCTNLTVPPELPATTLAIECYAYMFKYCASLITTPKLPVTTLAKNCYIGMFTECNGLTKPCELPATTMVEGCYKEMFSNCTGIKWATSGTPYRLPSSGTGTTASNWSQNMFSGNSGTSIPTTPEINTTYYLTPETTLKFTGSNVVIKNNLGHKLQYSLDNSTWTILAAGSSTPVATTVWIKGAINQISTSTSYTLSITGTDVAVSGQLQDNVNYHHLFYNNQTSLVYADGLICPINLVNNACEGLFHTCKNLKTPPTLPATILKSNCYSLMFCSCASLITCPNLPAENLATRCYKYMFSGCVSLTAPCKLPATLMLLECYYEMFAGCSGINWASSGTEYRLPTSGTGTTATNWNTNMFKNNSGSSIPTTPTINTTYYFNPLTILKFTGTNVVIKNNLTVALKYSTDNSTWTDLAIGSSTPTSSNVWIKGAIDQTSATAGTNYLGITGTYVAVSGKLNDNICYKYLFYNQSNLVDASGLIMPRIITANGCRGLFGYCSNLVTPPLELPATQLSYYCCAYMFQGCTKLKTSPVLNAQILDEGCCYAMFTNCSSLTIPPTLPAMTLTESCYREMFYNCISLTTAPELPATTLASNCYRQMFYNCTSLKSVPTLPATKLANNCYNSMFQYCTSLITPPALPATTLGDRCYQYMFANCTALTSCPALNATSLKASCYLGMFASCTSLKAPCALKATSIPVYAYMNMFVNCTGITWTTDTTATAYRLPTTGTGSGSSDWSTGMFNGNSGTLPGSGTPVINTTYYYKNS